MSDLVSITLTDIWNFSSEEKWWREINGVPANLIRQDTAATINVYAYNFGPPSPLRSVYAELPRLTADIENNAGEIVYETSDGTELLRFDFPTYNSEVLSGYPSPDQSSTTMATFVAYTGDLVFRVTRGTIFIAGVGTIAGGGTAAPPTLTSPTAARISGVGAVAGSGLAAPPSLASPTAIRISGVGSIAGEGTAAAPTITPNTAVDVRIAGVGTIAGGGTAALTIDSFARFFPHEGTLTKSGNWWNEATATIPADITTASTAQALNVRIAGATGSRVLRLRLSGSIATDFTDRAEQRVRVALWDGSTADDAAFLVDASLSEDDSPGSPYNLPITNDQYSAINSASDTLFYRLHDPAPIDIGGVGTVAGSGTAAIVVAPQIRITGVGTIAGGGTAQLTLATPTVIRISGVGTIASSGTAAITIVANTAADIRMAGVGTIVGSGTAALTVEETDNPFWPEHLVPDEMLSRAFTQSLIDGVSSFPVDQGPPLRRRRYTQAIKVTRGIIPMSDAEFAAFETFYNGAMDGGRAQFNIRNPLDRSTYMLVALVGAPTRVRRGDRWDVTLQLRSLE